MSGISDPAPVARGRLPSGTVSFAFTDIEGSTQRWDRDPAAMQAAVRRHDTLMRAAIEQHGGYVFKTLGDAFCAAFTRPADAVTAMLAGQRALAAEDFSAVGGLRVRAAVHTGISDERDGDYFGPVLNRVARLLSIGHGGQILVSGVTSTLVANLLPADVVLRDLGQHRLKDLTSPEHVFGLVAPDLAAEHPPLRSLDVHPNNLPTTFSTFIGREREVAELTELVLAHRIVSLVGAGGIGKTRTALQVAANSLDGSGDGVWFIELAPLASGENVPTAIAQPLGITLAVDADPIAQLVRALAAKNLLLVLDNCEHVIAATAAVVDAILRGCPRITILTTSRQPLNLSGEQTYRLPSLPVPRLSASQPLTLYDASQSAAVALFVERARAVDRNFELTDANAATVVDICRRVDGIALAIELAAARVKILSPRQLQARLNERFRVLTGGSRDALPRQQTLRALIDWSYDLLDARERALFARLGVFVDGFTLEAVVAVAGGDDLDEFELIDLLSSLADKSLLLAEPAGDSLRYRMLDSTRAYALERAQAVADTALLSARHAAHYEQYAARASKVASPADRLLAIETELENLRAALSWALAEQNDVGLGARILKSMGYYWYTRLPHEGLRWIERARAALPAGSDPQLAAQLAAARAGMLPHGSYERVEAARVALEQSRACDDPLLSTQLIAYAEQVYVLQRFDEAQAAFEEGLERAKAAGNAFNTARALAGLGAVAQERDDLAAARTLGGQTLEIFERIGATDGIAYVSMQLGLVAFLSGDLARAEMLYRRGRDISAELQNARTQANASDVLAVIALASGDGALGRAHARDALEALGADRHPLYFTLAIQALAYAATRLGDPRRGALLRGYSQNVLGNLANRDRSSRWCANAHQSELEAALDSDELAALLAAGAQLSEDRALAEALAV